MTTTQTTLTATEWLAARATDLAAMIPTFDLTAFLALPIRSQAVGIAVFAKLADDQSVRGVAMRILNEISEGA